jgi:hypothetical protein
MVTVTYAECHIKAPYAERHYAERHYAEYRYAVSLRHSQHTCSLAQSLRY